MAHEQYDINDIKGSDGEQPSLIQRTLLALFPRNAAEAIYGFGVDTVAFFAKIGLVFWLPFKFVQFWVESYKKNGKK